MTHNFLIVGPSWVGDMVMAHSLFQLLKARHLESALDVLAPAWAAPVLARMPEVRRSIDMPVGHGSLQLGQRYRLGRELAAVGYQQAVLLPNSLKSALVPFFARIPLRTGWRGELRYGLLNDWRKLDKARYPLMVERFAALAFAADEPLPAELPRPRLTVDRANQQGAAQRLGLVDDRPLLGLCPGAQFGSSKQWPAGHYGALAQHYIEQGWQVLVLGSDNDKPSAAGILEALPTAARAWCFDGTGSTTLVDAVDLLALCRVVVSNDSGLMHVAAAVDRPLVAIYGSSSPGFTPPLADRVAIVARELDCRPCFERECPLGHLDCLRKLEPAEVIAAVERLVDVA